MHALVTLYPFVCQQLSSHIFAHLLCAVHTTPCLALTRPTGTLRGTDTCSAWLARAVIPPFHSAVDRAISYLDPVHGLLGVADFYVPSKYDLPLRQMSWLRRFFWRCAALPHVPVFWSARVHNKQQRVD